MKTVDRAAFWVKMFRNVVQGKICNVIRNMYRTGLLNHVILTREICPTYLHAILECVKVKTYHLFCFLFSLFERFPIIYWKLVQGLRNFEYYY